MKINNKYLSNPQNLQENISAITLIILNEIIEHSGTQEIFEPL